MGKVFYCWACRCVYLGRVGDWALGFWVQREKVVWGCGGPTRVGVRLGKTIVAINNLEFSSLPTAELSLNPSYFAVLFQLADEIERSQLWSSGAGYELEDH